ncbi:unnamed protein product [Adineta steineri]|uniref:Innexin n=1 Tax=Adineta steineri TaxID=433720 RepID=A0A813YR81_9BILA|nr:unnamed protein product [Adineta steineri]CAF0887939.1 unnamed protein product [Adineta steineri]CAF3686260.1 unnamed protein product [Adineta steineri]CAF3819548.1 unnamed protein product [Adineta steineri]
MSALILKAANEFSTLFLGTSRSDDSAGDRLSYRYTCAILIAFTIIVSNREFTSKRIQCWVPAFFTGNYEDYTNNVCWVRNTYYIDDNSEIPESAEIRHDTSIRYYQWIPFILLFQAFLFFIPYVLWRVLCQRSGIDIRDIVEAATNYKKANDEKQRDRLMKFMVQIIDQYVDDPRRQSNNRETVWWKKFALVFFPSSGRYMGDYLRNLFIFIKIIYVINAVAQVLILSLLLGQPFYSLGTTVIRLLYQGKGWDFTSRYFPKVTLCDFQIREANALPIAHTYTVMCVLPINLFNQQIFTFLWFWIVFVIILTIYDLCMWIFRLFFRRDSYLEGRLKVMDYELTQKWPFNDFCVNHVNVEDMERIRRIQSRDETVPSTGDEVYVLSDGRKIHHQSRMFIVPPVYYEGKGKTIFAFFNEEYLEADGHFILRIVGTNASEFVSTKMIHDLYQMCCNKRFKPYDVQIMTAPLRTTLYKYLVIPKEGQPPPEPPETEQPKTPTIETRPSVNPLIQRYQSHTTNDQHPPEVKRRTSQNPSSADHQTRPRSDTLPFLEQPEPVQVQYASTTRRGNGMQSTKRIQQYPQYDEHEEEGAV